MLFLGSSRAQRIDPEKALSVNKTHAVGFAAGFTTGYGLSYRYFPNRFGLQVTFSPFKRGEEQRHSFGITFLHELMDNGKINFFLYQGNHFLYDEDIVFSYPPPNYTSVERKTISRNYNHGIGVGTEFRMGSKITMNVMTGYAAYDSFNSLSITAELGIFFQLL